MASTQVDRDLPRKTLLANISSYLDAADAPSLMWDTNLLCSYGVPTVIFEFSFVVPDDRLQAAYDALKNREKISECDLGPECITVKHVKDRPQGAKHLHVYDDCVLHLITQSQVFHPDHLPNMSLDGGDIVLASDERYPIKSSVYAPFPDHLHPVRMPTPVFFTNALLQLSAREIDQDNLYFAHWMVMLTYIGQYVARYYPERFQAKALRPDLRHTWSRLSSTRKLPGETTATIMRKLRSELPYWAPQSMET